MWGGGHVVFIILYMTINVFSSFVCKEYVIVHALLTKHVLEKSSKKQGEGGKGLSWGAWSDTAHNFTSQEASKDILMPGEGVYFLSF